MKSHPVGTPTKRELNMSNLSKDERGKMKEAIKNAKTSMPRRDRKLG